MKDEQHGLNRILLEAVQAITADLNLTIVLPRILEELARLVRYDSASIMLLEGDTLSTVERRSVFPLRTEPFRLRVSELSHIYAALSQHKPVYIADTSRDSRWMSRPGNENIRSWIGAPLIANGRILGLLNVSHSEPYCFSDVHVEIIGAFAAFAAIALHNAELSHRLQAELNDRERAEADLQRERALLAQRLAEQTAALRAANQEMARASRMKDEFLAAMSHELRTPLSVIISMTDLLSEEAYGSITEPQRQALDRISQSSRHLLSLISDVLDVARIESGKLHLLAQEVEIDALCRAAIEQANIDARRLHFTYRIEPDLPPLIGDERRLRQVLVNLLSNAIKFTPEGGSFGLEVERDKSHDCLALTVWDTGIGIEENDLQRLFQPFIQLDGRLNRRYEGTGLGLTLVHRLTALHGGSLAIQSRKGAGSRFIVRIPWKAVLENPSIEEAKDPAAPLILLITRLKHAENLLIAALQAAGRRVEVILPETEESPQERPSMVILIGYPPLRNTLRMLNALENNDLLVDAPKIVLTTLDLPGDREKILAAGATEFDLKPLPQQKLQALLNRGCL
ncbi:MAG: GAF domain-containing sensor histidine kinase [Caldilinea sp.]|nr:GAF domain-containing sensor histidine kinase [Caldilinea sp.]MDW8441230.1 GAF domain-containing sensor histidine kinase [Caldilineaceae bacterium]